MFTTFGTFFMVTFGADKIVTFFIYISLMYKMI